MENKLKLVFIAGLCFLLFISTNIIAADFPQLSGPYLGQKVPGLKPIPFAKGLLSTKKQVEINSVFSTDGNEFFYVTRQFRKQRYDLMYSNHINGNWTEPKRLKIAGDYSVVDIALSPDGKRLYFCSDLPTIWLKPEGYDIWYVERTESGWSEPVHTGTNINSPFKETQPTFTRSGTVYFPSRREGTNDESADIFFAEFKDGEFLEAKPLPESINSIYNEGNSFIAPDESYILFARWGSPKHIDGGRGLYISFKMPDGSWTEAINTAPVLGIYGSLAALSPDGRYLFYSTKRGIYWVDAKVVDKLKRLAVNQ